MRHAAFAIAGAASLFAASAHAQWPVPAPRPPVPSGQPAPAMPAGMPQVILPPVPVPGAEETVQRLEEAKRSDSGRKLEWVWVDAHGGFEQVGLQTFSGTQAFAARQVATSSSGGVVGLGAGVRLLYLTLLARGRVGFGSMGQLWRVGPEVGFHVPFGKLEPHVELGGGYAALGGLVAQGAAAPAMSIRGGYGRVGAGLDWFVIPVLSLGLDVSAELLGLSRAALSATDAKKGGVDAPFLAQSAGAIGGTVAATAVLGLHF